MYDPSSPFSPMAREDTGRDSGFDSSHAMSVVFDNAPDALFLLSRVGDARWELRSCNPRTAEFFDTPQDELIGKTLEDVFGDGALSENGRAFTDLCAESRQTLEREVYLAARPEDLWIEFNWWHFKFVPVPETAGQIRHIAGICQKTTATRQLRDALQKFSSAINQAGAIIAIVELDGTIEYVNPAFGALTGYEDDAVIGQSIFQLCMPPNADDLYMPVIAAMSRRSSWQGELPSEKQDGSVYWESVRVSPISDDKGLITHFLVIKEDITEKRATQNQLKLASRVLDTTDAGVVITDAHGKITSVNPAYTRITGYSTEEAVGKTPGIAKSGSHDAEFYAAMWRDLKTRGHWTGDLVDRNKNGEIFVENITISALYDSAGQTTHYVGVFSDITALRESQRRLENIANFDALTHLPNRHHLMDRLQHALLLSRREDNIVTLIYFDLDHFKVVNDTLGHSAGDALLKEVSLRVQAQLRDEDTLARLGGDEFVAILEGVELPERISVVAERIIADLNRPFVIGGNEVFVGCSMGIAFYPRDGADADMLMRNADLALYRAKEEGKNCYRLYSEEMNVSAHLRYQIEIRLRKAIEAGEFSLVYQPQFDVQTRRLVGAEALLRWVSPDSGPISPAQFIPIAEQTGLIVPIGLWVMQQVCQAQRVMMDAGEPMIKIAVNVSPVQFRQKDLVESFQHILATTGVPASCVEIEVTEGTIMVDAEKAIATLKHLRDIGLTIAVDDFGTGYSSLGYLKRFPIDKIKIDRTFVMELESNQDDAVIISAIIAMSHSLGMKTLAEGVETEAQMDYLATIGCNEIQGYLLGKPLPLDALRAVVQKDREADGSRRW